MSGWMPPGFTAEAHVTGTGAVHFMLQGDGAVIIEPPFVAGEFGDPSRSPCALAWLRALTFAWSAYDDANRDASGAW
jgi:hypothetical protein